MELEEVYFYLWLRGDEDNYFTIAYVFRSGSRYVEVTNLVPSRINYASGYSETINPSTISEFAGAAFRSYHSTVQGFIRFINLC